MSDRTVHAITGDGWEVVRYDRSGKWWAEKQGERRPIDLEQAVGLAAAPSSRLWLNRPGGRAFKAKLSRLVA